MPTRKPATRAAKRSSGARAPRPAVLDARLVTRSVIRIDWFRRFTRRRCLCFTMRHQEQTQWCWSATATSVAHYYNAASTWTQCSLVNAELGRGDCCTSPSSNNCNQPWTLNTVLTRVGHLASFAAGATSFADVQVELDNGRPLGVRIGWSGGGGHFNVIACYTSNVLLRLRSVHVEDPWYGSSVWDYDSFRTAYQGTGSWTHSYKTEA